jgi:hypothetical protein
MNYTNPNNLDHNDTPEDWLNSSLIFARSLGLIFKENEGVVVDLMGDMRFGDEGNIKKVIVFKSNDMVRVIECEEDLKEGSWVIVHDINPN